MTAMSFLESLQVAAHDADVAEAAFRREVATRIAAIEQNRAFAYRRLNLMKAVAEAVGQAEEEQPAVAYALALLRSRLGWESDSDARAAVLARFAPVARAIFVSLIPNEQPSDLNEPPRDLDVGAALMRFEAWYSESHTTPFWTLFENYMPETPRVDF
jgi:hypothetical protein